ncbi:MAG: hypothetical protein M3328_02620 [Chloroflexota bacterium]|nr:hypothetical protein [Chloroflexota bacterium]
MSENQPSNRDKGLEIVGERLPCWDAKRRVWQAIDLLSREQVSGWEQRMPLLRALEQSRLASGE